MTDGAGSEEPVCGPVRKFNPGTLQSDADVVEQFVVRRTELGILLDVVRGNLDRASCQHALVVAPRGRGKTMLLARVAAELRAKEEFREALLPVRFMEESHEIVDVGDFWLEALFHLGREVAPARPELAGELQATHAALCERWRERGLADLARAAVLDAADRLERRLVLMVENLQSLSANADPDFGWQVRGVLQTEPRVMLLGSATSRFEGLDDPEEPFFELFRVVDLKPLGTDQCRRLWEAAGGDPRSGRDIRPLEILTGGNPRLLVIVAGFSRHRSLQQLMEELVGLIDEHTEYFRGHLEGLPRQERRVYVATIDLWRPSTTGEIAARARMDVRAASTMLGRLIDRGAVTRSGEGRRRLYAAAEPLHSIYYKLRRERDEAAVVENLIMFMMGFYDEFVLYELLDRLWPEARDSRPLHTGIERALARRPEEGDVGTRSRRDATRASPTMAWDLLADVSTKVRNHHRAKAAMRLQEGTEAAFREGNAARVIELVDTYVAEGWKRAHGSMIDHDTAYLGHLRAEAYLRMGEFEKVAAIGRDLLRRFRTSRDVFVQWRTAVVLLRQTEAHTRAGEPAAAFASARELVSWFGERDDPQFGSLVADALVRQAEAESEMGRFEAADALLDEVVARFGGRDGSALAGAAVAALVSKADVARAAGRDGATVGALYDRAIERGRRENVEAVGRSLSVAFLNRALLRAGIDDFEGEIASYEEFVDLFGDNDTFASEVAFALAFRSLREAELGFAERAMDGCEELDRRLGGLTDAMALWIRGVVLATRATALMAGGKTDAGVEAFGRTVKAFPVRDELAVRTVTRLTLNLIALGAPERELLAALARDRTKRETLVPLMAALWERVGEEVRVPAEVRSVAADVRRQIEERTDTGRLVPF